MVPRSTCTGSQAGRASSFTSFRCKIRVCGARGRQKERNSNFGAISLFSHEHVGRCRAPRPTHGREARAPGLVLGARLRDHVAEACKCFRDRWPPRATRHPDLTLKPRETYPLKQTKTKCGGFRSKSKNHSRKHVACVSLSLSENKATHHVKAQSILCCPNAARPSVGCFTMLWAHSLSMFGRQMPRSQSAPGLACRPPRFKSGRGNLGCQIQS